MQMVIYMKVNGLTIWLTEKDNTLILEEGLTKANGSMINNMVMVMRNGRMDQNTKGRT